MRISKFEQSALLIKTINTQVAIDFGGLTPKLPIIAGPVDGAFVSHVHGDHFNIDHLRALGAPIWAAKEAAQRLEEAGISAELLTPEKTVCIGDLKITPVEVDHGSISVPISNLGFIIQSKFTAIFFAGDMAIPLAFPLAKVDVLIIPVGGGKVFNVEEAANYIAANNYHGRIVPVHFHGQADPSSALRLKELIGSKTQVVVLEVGEGLEVSS